MPYYWDAFLGKLQEQGISVADITPRQLLERYHNWYQHQVAGECERGDPPTPGCTAELSAPISK